MSPRLRLSLLVIFGLSLAGLLLWWAGKGPRNISVAGSAPDATRFHGESRGASSPAAQAEPVRSADRLIAERATALTAAAASSTPPAVRIFTPAQRAARADAPAAIRLPADAAPRLPLPKEPIVRPPGEVLQLTVKFADRFFARADESGTLLMTSERDEAALVDAVARHQLRFRRNLHTSEASLANLQQRAADRTGRAQPDLAGMLIAESPAATSADDTVALATALQALPQVEFVTLASLDRLPPPPASDIAPTTPSLVDKQGYRGTSGINAEWAWTNHNAKGQGVTLRQCEYSYNASHEDLADLVTLQPNLTSMCNTYGDNHGTAAVGIYAAGDNDYGMTGLIPQASVVFYSDSGGLTIGGETSGQTRLAAITAAINDSAAGDVVVLEMQSTGPNGKLAPEEYQSDTWTVVKTGTDAGVIVVGAGGNNGENLDSDAYATYRSRGDSGAIIVGAGSKTYENLSFSTYGSRVNLQGWGEGVASTGDDYGSWRYGDDHNQAYTNGFNGTSSATPIVAGACAILQSAAKAKLNRPLTPSELRTLLVDTGKAQTGSTASSRKIGPLPDLEAAIPEMINRHAGSFSISGNLSGLPDSIITQSWTGATVEAGGVAATVNSDGTYSISNLPPGTYTVTPRLPNRTLSPASQSVTLGNANVTGTNFAIAYQTVSGRVTGIASDYFFGIGPFINLSSGESFGCTWSDADSAWLFSIPVPDGRTFYLSASDSVPSGFTNPVTASAPLTGINFASATNRNLTGRVTFNSQPLSGVTITLSGGNTGTCTTDSDGYYRFDTLAGSSTTITPSKTGYSFTSASVSVTPTTTTEAQNFTAASTDSSTATPQVTALTASPTTANAPGTATLTATATGVTPFTYHWAATTAPRAVTFDTNDATTNSTVVHLTKPGIHTFQVTITDTLGFTANSTVNVTGVAPPVITSQPVAAIVDADASASFAVTATGTGLTYQWKKDGTNLTDGGRISGATTASLSIATTEAGDMADYTCLITTSEGGTATTLSVRLTVRGFAKWIATYSSLTATAATDDPDGDGFANLLEYALDTGPDSSASRPNLTCQISDSKLQITFTPQRADIIYTVEASDDLSDWSDSTDLTGLLTVGTPYTHTDSTALSAGTKRFLRLKVSQP
jgi:hypothetical protein